MTDTIMKVSTPASPLVELHETVMGSNGTMQMQEKQGGFVIPAKGELILEPGANHIMLMGLTKPIEAGDVIAFDLKPKTAARLPLPLRARTLLAPKRTTWEAKNQLTEPPWTMDHGSMNHGETATESTPSLPAN